MRKLKRKSVALYDLDPSVFSSLVSDFDLELSGAYLRSTHASERFRIAYLREQLLSKLNDPSSGTSATVRRQLAIEKWRTMELRNVTTNVRLFLDDEVKFKLRFGHLSLSKVVERARDTIERVIGVEPPVDVLYGTFTSGASTAFSRKPGVMAEKFREAADTTLPCLARFTEMYDRVETWKSYRDELGVTPKIVSGGVLFTVPKNSEIDRCAVKEPDLNMFCQKGVGDYFRHSLRSKLRLDLNDQTRNQRLAREGSISGALATLDLSSASDLISDGVVRKLLPEAWFDLLNDIRSRAIVVDGVLTELNMFSSMGNAFTFELETLIFYSIVNALCYLTGTKGTVSVYGDDIICPSSVAGLVAKVFSYFGFIVNTKKSKWSGPFRESCGKHWYSGTDVTPFYVKEPILSVDRMIHFLNRLRYWSKIGSLGIADDTFFPLWEKYSRYVPPAFHGGRDCSRIDALVAPCAPRMRLMRGRRPKTVSDLGGYLHWLRATCNRVGPILEPVVTSSVITETQVWVKRRSNVAKGTQDMVFFINELMKPPS